MARGKLIVFEGLDRAGKSTQCQKLVDGLREKGAKVRLQRFPGTCCVYWLRILFTRAGCMGRGGECLC